MCANRNKSANRAIVLVMVFMALMIMPGHADAQDVFAGLAGMNHVESTYISGRFSHNKKYWTSDTGEHRIDLRRGFSSFYSYKCSSEESVSKAEEILKSYLKKNPDLEIMVKTQRGLEEYVVYEKFIDDGKKVTQMIIWNKDTSNSCEIAVINWDQGLERKTLGQLDQYLYPDIDMAFGDLENIYSMDCAEYESFAKEMQEMSDELNAAFSSPEWKEFMKKEWKNEFKKKE